MIDFTAIYVLWIRELKRSWRSKPRILGSLAMPVFFLVSLGFGFGGMSVPGVSEGVGYLDYLVPGMLGMIMLFSSTMAGLSVLFDREFGFLKEIMVTPVSRTSIVLGRTVGSMTTSILQALLVLALSTLMGFKVTGLMALIGTLLFMVLISTTFIGMGLVFAAKLSDMEAFPMIMNFVIFPLFFLSGALYPIDNLPSVARYVAAINPLTYGVDGMRGVLLGANAFALGLDVGVCFLSAFIMVFLGAYLFERSESV